MLSRTNLAGSSPSISCTSSISFAFFRLRTLDLSLRSFSPLDPLFSITSALFSQNTGGGGISTRPRHALLPPSHAPRGASIPCALTRLPILPVTTGVWALRFSLAARHSPLATFLPPFVFILLQIPFPATLFFSHPCKSPGMWEYPALSTPAHPRVVAATLKAGAGEKLALRRRGSSGPKRVVPNALSCNDCRGNGTTQAVIREEF